MGYDYEIQTICKCCGHANDRKDLYTTYNHGWAFYEYLDKKHGLRWLYGKTGRGTIKRLETMLECLEQLDGYYNNFSNYPEGGDGWRPTVGNAYYFAKRILEEAKTHPKGKWSGD